MVYMVTQKSIGSPEAVVIYFGHFAVITCHLHKALPINHSQSQPFCLVTQRKEAVHDKTNGCMGLETNSLRAQPVIVSSRKVTPPGNSWWGCAARFSKSWIYFRPKHVIFYTRFQTWPLNSIPILGPCL